MYPEPEIIVQMYVEKKVVTEGAYYANHVFNPFFYEGTKTYIYETYEQLKRVPENIFIELGNGTLFIGAVLALEHLLASGVISHFPQVIAIQASGCAPFFETVEKQLESSRRNYSCPHFGRGIAIGKPARAEEIMDMIKRHNIRVVTAPEEEILPARRKLAAGVFTPSIQRRRLWLPMSNIAKFTGLLRTLYCQCAEQVLKATIKGRFTQSI